MECIKLHINHLGRVVDSDIELSRMVIFSGESSLGKSYMAMLCHYFYEILLNTTRLARFFEDKNIKYDRAELKNSGIACVIRKTDLQEWMAKDVLSYLEYLLGYQINGDLNVLLPPTIFDSIEINYEEQLTGLVEELETYVLLSTENLSYKVKDNDSFDESPFSVLLRYELIARIFGDFRRLRATFILPPSRGPLLTEQITPLTGLYMEFKNKFEGLKNPSMAQSVNSKALVSQVCRVLEGEVIRKDSMYIYSSSGIEMPISAAASSIRELAPLEIIAEKTDVKTDAILMEEPEAHLHPEKQRGVADILARMFVEGAFLQITTHSDYFLSRLNELILLGKLKQRASKDTFEKACTIAHADDTMVLDSSVIRTYLLERTDNGRSKVILKDLENGVSFASFRKAVEDNLEIGSKLEELLEYGEAL
jgi:predicted ATPase